MFAARLVTQFERIVSRDGGSLMLISVSDELIEIGYRMGSDANCDSAACVLPHVELQELMNQTVARQRPGTKVVVQLVS
jgi:hypothetical protein